MIVEDAAPQPTLCEVIDRLLARGVVIRGELWLTVADVELVFVGAHLALATPDAIRPPPGGLPGRRPPAGRVAP